jgi:2-haloacid dehalogenase
MASSSLPVSPIANEIDALTFDVFGTVVDWLPSVTEELAAAAAAKLASPSADELSPDVRGRLAAVGRDGWAALARDWRASYGEFTHTFVPGETPWKDIDTHHLDSLHALLAARGLEGAYTPSEAGSLSHAWHRLAPWPDSAEGLRRLGARYVTATLSNGNRSLLSDLDGYGNLGFRRIVSAADFGAYKPHPSVYRGAAAALGVPTGRVAMVAAHLGDLAAARGQGMRTVYVERAGEEEMEIGSEEYEAAKGWVDVWVGVAEGGLVEVARRFGA